MKIYDYISAGRRVPCAKAATMLNLLLWIIGCTLGTSLLTTLQSCSDMLDYEGPATGTTGTVDDDDDFVDVTIDVDPEDFAFNTRAIGEGNEIDMLIYAVYVLDESDKENNDDIVDDGTGTYLLLTQYKKGIDKNLIGTNALPKKDGSDTELKDAHLGQTIIDLTHFGYRYYDSDMIGYCPNEKEYKDNIDNKTEAEASGIFVHDRKNVTIKMRLQRKKYYRIAFWAQSSKTTAYNTNSLRLVTVNYDGAVNNDETRDAFCKTEIFSVSTVASSRQVTLQRPLAQVNVATQEDNLKGYTHSKLELKGVAKYMDLVLNKVIIDKAELQNRAKNPDAYDMNGDQINKLKEELTKYSDGDVLPTATFNWAPFMKEDLTVDKDGTGQSQDYKYLAMSYVLVPDSKNYPGDENFEILTEQYLDSDGTTKTRQVKKYTYETTLESMKFFFSKDADDNNSQSQTVNYLPVFRNYRTNILGLKDSSIFLDTKNN